MIATFNELRHNHKIIQQFKQVTRSKILKFHFSNDADLKVGHISTQKKISSLDKDLEIFVKLINCIKGRERESSTKE